MRACAMVSVLVMYIALLVRISSQKFPFSNPEPKNNFTFNRVRESHNQTGNSEPSSPLVVDAGDALQHPPWPPLLRCEPLFPYCPSPA
jgi:hypothetical protein